VIDQMLFFLRGFVLAHSESQSKYFFIVNVSLASIKSKNIDFWTCIFVMLGIVCLLLSCLGSFTVAVRAFKWSLGQKRVLAAEEEVLLYR